MWCPWDKFFYFWLNLNLSQNGILLTTNIPQWITEIPFPQWLIYFCHRLILLTNSGKKFCLLPIPLPVFVLLPGVPPCSALLHSSFWITGAAGSPLVLDSCQMTNCNCLFFKNTRRQTAHYEPVRGAQLWKSTAEVSCSLFSWTKSAAPPCFKWIMSSSGFRLTFLFRGFPLLHLHTRIQHKLEMCSLFKTDWNEWMFMCNIPTVVHLLCTRAWWGQWRPRHKEALQRLLQADFFSVFKQHCCTLANPF